MEKLSIPAFTFTAKTYCLLTKPGIILGNIITMVAGYTLASRGKVNPWIFFITLVGLSLIIASACVFNNYIDRDFDKKMTRTKNRALALGLISGKNAILFACGLGFLGAFLLIFFVNLLTTAIALFGFFVYVILYSFSKYRSIHGTLIGSVAGAIPPVVGYCAACNHFDLAAFILFTMVALWQMPHFFAIAIYRLDEYAAAAIPVLPVKKGIRTTKIHMIFYIIAFISVCLLLTVFEYTGYIYLLVAVSFGLFWLGLCLKGFRCFDDKLWARKMFVFSLVIILGLCIAIPFSLISYK